MPIAPAVMAIKRHIIQISLCAFSLFICAFA